jgi:hypothetical protein
MRRKGESRGHNAVWIDLSKRWRLVSSMIWAVRVMFLLGEIRRRYAHKRAAG